MSYCINPDCSKPENAQKVLFCQTCGSDLLLEGCYRINRPLGGGGFGNTYEIDECGELKILKVLHNTVPKAVSLFQQEAQVLSQLHHHGIPKVDMDGYFTYTPRDSQTPLHCLVMEKIEGMNLEEYMLQRGLKPISTEIALSWIRQITEILQQVHNQNYFHLDIQPSNIILKLDGSLALIDFSIVGEANQTYIQTIAGENVPLVTPSGYTPPEQEYGKVVAQSDFYALGRTFVYLLTGKSPLDFTDDFYTGELLWQEGVQQVPQPLINLINELMSPSPRNRPQDAETILLKIAKIDALLRPPPSVGWKFFCWWVLANALSGMLMGSILNHTPKFTLFWSLPDVLETFILEITYGLIVGFFQWLVLRQHLRPIVGWVWSTFVGYIVVATMVGGIGSSVWYIAGAVIGYAQSITLRKHLRSSSWWVLVSFIAWGIACIFLSILAILVSPEVENTVGSYFLFGLLQKIYALITGLALIWLLNNRRRHKKQFSYSPVVSISLRDKANP